MNNILLQYGFELTELLVGLLLILMGVLVLRFPMLIAGYNTMSAERRKQVDVKGLKRCMFRGLAVLGLGWLLLPPLMRWTGHPNWATMLYTLWTPLVAIVLMVRIQRYDKGKQ